MGEYKVVNGRCYCGSVCFRAQGAPIFNVLCHCRPCSRARGVSPVHLYGVPEEVFAITKGEDLIKVVTCPEDQLTKSYNNSRPMTHAFCSNCGSFIYQRPQGAGFRALSPVSFQIETKLSENDETNVCGVSSILPEELWPMAHYNYENRVRNHYDALPKYRTFKHGGVRLTNEGEVVEEDQFEKSKGFFEQFVWSELEGMPLEAGRALALNEVAKMLDEEYVDVEHGYVRNEDMTWYVACSTPLGKECTGEMIDFWFSHVDDSERYKWWHPVDHEKGTWSRGYFDVPAWKRGPQHYVGHRHIVTERVGGDLQHIQIEWVTPWRFGFGVDREECMNKFEKSNVTACACGVVHAYDFPFGYLRAGYLVHMVRYDPLTGESELRSRFWLGLVDGSNPVIKAVGNTAWFRRMKLPEWKVRGLLRHCAEEMFVLSRFLPGFYESYRARLRKLRAEEEAKEATLHRAGTKA